MKKGDKLIQSELGKENYTGNYKKMVCVKAPNSDGVATIEYQGIRDPNRRMETRLHKDFLKVIE